jgi:hypothetical protein
MADCSLTTLVQGAKCFDCLSATERAALKSKFLADALLALGGPDYTNRNVKRQVTACLQCLPDFRLDSIETLVFQRLAINAGAGAKVNLPINQLRAAISCAVCGDTVENYNTEVIFFECQLNKFFGTGAL